MANDPMFFDPALFRLVCNASPAGMIISEPKGRIVFANTRAEEMFGYGPGELIGEVPERLIPDADADAHLSHRVSYAWRPTHRPMGAGRDLYAKRKDGSEFPVDISLHPIESDIGTLVLAHVLDASDRHRAKRERESRQRMERLALLGQLAGGVAHEIRTPLCVITNDTHVLRQLVGPLGGGALECIDEIERATEKANRIVSELLDFTRQRQAEPAHRQATAAVRIDRLLDAAIREAGLSEGIRVARPPTDGEISLRIDPEPIQRVLANLLRNASQAMRGRGPLDLKVTSTPSRVMIDVEDRGEGIANDQLELIFEPLFTTRPNGIGLGLAVSRRYAEQHGGTLTAENREGGGARFRLALPRQPEAAEGEPAC